ncbi:MAG: accessory gene regulator B family protein [Lachnospiraceae bacterium]
MSKGPFDSLALKLTNKLFRYDEYTNTKSSDGIDNKVVNNADVTKNRNNKAIDDKTFEIKKAKVYYSINLLLNESTKLLIIVILAILLHVFVKCLFCLFILMLTRSILGGLHGKSYLQCLLITMICVLSAIYISPFIVVNYWIAGVILAIWCILVMVVGPIQSKNRLKIKDEKRRKNKAYLLVISITLFGITVLMGNEFNQMYAFLLLFQMAGILVL